MHVLFEDSDCHYGYFFEIGNSKNNISVSFPGFTLPYSNLVSNHFLIAKKSKIQNIFLSSRFDPVVFRHSYRRKISMLSGKQNSYPISNIEFPLSTYVLKFFHPSSSSSSPASLPLLFCGLYLPG